METRTIEYVNNGDGTATRKETYTVEEVIDNVSREAVINIEIAALTKRLTTLESEKQKLIGARSHAT